MRLFLILSIAFLLLGTAHPAQAQSSWWDKNASPALQAEEAAVTARPRPEPVPAGPPPLFLGAALIIGDRGKLIPANIVGRPATADGSYLVETRRGSLPVASCDVFDPLNPVYVPSQPMKSRIRGVICASNGEYPGCHF